MLLCLFLVNIVIPVIANIAENGLFLCSSHNAVNKFNEFKCQNGTCIDLKHVCDGVQHCPDASDEDFCKNSRKRSKRSNACILPAYPSHGTYEVSDNLNARPGQSLESFSLTVRCRRGFGVVNRDGSTGSSGKAFCVKGVWDQKMPQCVRFCRLNPDPSVRYMCHLPGVGLRVCDDYVAPGTLVSPICNTPIYYSSRSFQSMKCTSGFWNYVAQCEVECGRVTPEGFQLIIDGKNAKRGELPWHVGIYRKNSNTLEQICGGSLISNNLIISAAHCFWSDVRKVLPASDYKVAIGKLHRSWDSEEEVGVQKSDVKDIKIPTLFEGESANFQEDIAVLVLVTPFIYKTYIRPVCLNFDVNFERFQLRHDNLGKVAGWGLTAANGNASPILKVVDMPFVEEVICIKTLPQSFREYLTGDKFCAGYTNGIALCRGDSGGGLAFPDRELGIDRFYLRGIVSAAPRNDDKMCNDNAYTTFTKITKHQDLINGALAESASRSCPFYSFQCDDGTCVDLGADCNGKQDCADGSDESDEWCKPTGVSSNPAVAESASRGCPLNSFKCDDGTCVDLGAKCNGKQDCADGSDESDEWCKPTGVSSNPSEETGSCILPSYPDNGRYVVQNVTNARPGQRLETFALSIICSEGYDIKLASGGIVRNKEIYCNNGVWFEKMPKCVHARCMWEGIRGQCVPSNNCLSALDDSLKRPTLQHCPSLSDKTPLVCCTDCELIKDSRLLLTNPVLGILVKTGTSKAKDKCLEYINTLDYPCKKDSSLRNITLQLDPVKNCYRKVNIQPSRTHYKDKRDALRKEFPHMALLGYEETPGVSDFQSQCSGAVISERFILTAAHCLIDRITRSPVKYITVGLLKRSDPPELWQRYNVDRAIGHPKYIPPHKYYDIALLVTDKEIAFSSAVLPACLHVDDETDTVAYFTGWGAQNRGGELSDTLQSMSLMRFSTEECKKTFEPTRILRDGYVNTTQMCYGRKDNTETPCQGLGSGLLHSQDHEQCVFTLIGVLSFGHSCNVKGDPSMYSRIKYFVSWIEEIVWP